MKRRFLLFSLCIAAFPATPPVLATSAQPAPQRIEITAKRFQFSLSEITIKRGQPVILVLKSLDVAHGLDIGGLGVHMKVTPGGTAEEQFTPEKAGDFRGHCAVFCGPRHGSMTFTVHVVN